jgi:hypothetical protein
VKVHIPGYGAINFPESMSEDEIRKVLEQFRRPKDDTALKLLESLEKNLKTKPQKDIDIRTIEVPVVTQNTEIRTVEIERVIPTPSKPVRWGFSIERDADGAIEGGEIWPIT